MTKDRVLDSLRSSGGSYVSGGALSAELSLSRTAVWKAVEQLREEGFVIESAPKKGYRLLSGGDALTESGVRAYLRRRDLDLRVYKSISSTNTVLKQLAESGEAEGTVLLAEEQTAGRGRMSRSFFSPPRSGLYMSLLLRPHLSAQLSTRITACAAVAVAEAIEELTGCRAEIKWVNDVLVDGKKVCGILTEGSIDCESGLMHYAIVGIGINIRPPEGDFPAELRQIAGALPAAPDGEDLRCRLAAAVLDRLMDLYEQLPEGDCYEAYKSRSCLIGRQINILPLEGEPVPATAIDVEPDFSLRVRLADGTETCLSSGEVSVRAK